VRICTYKSLPPIENVKSKFIKQAARAKAYPKRKYPAWYPSSPKGRVLRWNRTCRAVSQIEADKVCPWARFHYYPNSNQPNSEKRFGVSWCASKFARKTRASPIATSVGSQLVRKEVRTQNSNQPNSDKRWESVGSERSSNAKREPAQQRKVVRGRLARRSTHAKREPAQ